jgi:hypothetical protein
MGHYQSEISTNPSITQSYKNTNNYTHMSYRRVSNPILIGDFLLKNVQFGSKGLSATSAKVKSECTYTAVPPSTLMTPIQ